VQFSFTIRLRLFPGVRNEKAATESSTGSTERHQSAADNHESDGVYAEPKYRPAVADAAVDHYEPTDAVGAPGCYDAAAADSYPHAADGVVLRWPTDDSTENRISDVPAECPGKNFARRAHFGHRTSWSATTATSETAVRGSGETAICGRHSAVWSATDHWCEECDASGESDAADARGEASHVTVTCAISSFAVPIASAGSAVPSSPPYLSDAIAFAFSTVSFASHVTITVAPVDTIPAAYPTIATPFPTVSDARSTDEFASAIADASAAIADASTVSYASTTVADAPATVSDASAAIADATSTVANAPTAKFYASAIATPCAAESDVDATFADASSAESYAVAASYATVADAYATVTDAYAAIADAIFDVATTFSAAVSSSENQSSTADSKSQSTGDYILRLVPKNYDNWCIFNEYIVFVDLSTVTNSESCVFTLAATTKCN
jgi:hypothetical protein